LGRPGQIEAPEKLSLAFGRLINNATAKNPPHPLVVFTDTNLPFRSAQRVYAPQSSAPPMPSRYLVKLVERLRQDHRGKDPYAMLAFANHPQHYAGREPDPQKHLAAIISLQAPEETMEGLEARHHAVGLYGNIPDEFPEV
jgi:hypothetical protein